MTSPVPTQTATLHTSSGDIRVLLFGNHAPKTVANFVELAAGHEGVDASGHAQEVHRPALRRHGLPPRHLRLHDPGRRPAR